MALHGTGVPRSVAEAAAAAAPVRGSQAGRGIDPDETLAKRLELVPGEEIEPIPSHMLRKCGKISLPLFAFFRG